MVHTAFYPIFTISLHDFYGFFMEPLWLSRPCSVRLAQIQQDAAIDIRVHMVHQRSRHFPEFNHNCITCPVQQPSAPPRLEPIN
jgi:hypothetical protein